MITYAERFPNFAKIEDPAIRAAFFSYAHLWLYMKSGKWPLDRDEMPPHVAKMFDYIGESSGNPNERMFIYPVGTAKAYYRDPETGEETLVEDVWAGIDDYVNKATYFSGSKYDYCRESGCGSFEKGSSCYCDGLTCANFLGEGARTGMPETTFEMTPVEFKSKLRIAKERGEHFLDFGYGPPDTCAHCMTPTDRILTIGFCPYSWVGGWTTLWHPVCEATGVNNSLYYVEVNQDKCTACGRCAATCIVGELAYDKESRKAYLTTGDCMGCGRCSVACPEGAIKLYARHKDTAAFVHSQLDCRISVTEEAPPYDPEITPNMVKITPGYLDWFREHPDVDAMYAEWLEARGGIPVV